MTTPADLRALCVRIDAVGDARLFRALREALPASEVAALGIGPLRQVVSTLAAHAQQWAVGEAMDAEVLAGMRDAAEVLTTIREQFPDQSELYYAEVLVRRRLGEPEPTLELARAGYERFPRNWACVASFANALRDARQPVTALRYAKVAFEIDPYDGSPLYDAGWAFIEAGRGAEAALVFEELLQRFPDYPEGKDALARARATTS